MPKLLNITLLFITRYIAIHIHIIYQFKKFVFTFSVLAMFLTVFFIFQRFFIKKIVSKNRPIQPETVLSDIIKHHLLVCYDDFSVFFSIT